jgi:uncharacterized protein YqjF (DUF2071 family)
LIHFLRRHPFGVESFFRRSLVLTYALPAPALAALVGPGLLVDEYDGWGFLAIAMVDTRALRPRGFPAWLGRDFFLSGYRVFTRFARPGKQTLRGLRILRSDTNRRTMTTLGNIFTHYGYRLATVDMTSDSDHLEIRIRTPNREADLHVVADLASRPAPLPDGTPFRSTDDARAFAGPLPYTFDYESETGKMVVIKGLRQAWDPQPVRVEVREATFLERAPLAGVEARLANAFYLEGVPYAWKPGVLEDVS